jgi:hypothetical protein
MDLCRIGAVGAILIFAAVSEARADEAAALRTVRAILLEC